MTTAAAPADSSASPASPPAPDRDGPVRTWADPQTGRLVRQLTDAAGFPGGANLTYFRYPRHLAGGWMLARSRGRGPGGLMMLHPASGAIRALPSPGAYLRLRESDGRLWTFNRDTREVWEADLSRTPEAVGEPRLIGALPAAVPGHVSDVTADGRLLILLDLHQPSSDEYPAPTRKDPAMFWHYVTRPRSGRILTYDLQTTRLRTLVKSDGYCPFHTDSHPSDPTLLRFAYDRWEGHHQRVWSIRTDGSELRPIRPQAHGELITHEFYWSPADHVGFTYQDRRQDAQHHELPWCEYAPAATRLGIADLAGRQVYLSDPINHYHTHLYRSHDGRLVSGSGTDGNSGVYAARFSWDSTRVEFVKLASVHTPYVAFAGQKVNCDFSADGQWLIYSDTIEGVIQLCAVKVDLD